MPLAEARPGDLSALEQEEWVKVSWKKGECREEIKLIAEASGLTFDNARIVVRVCRNPAGVNSKRCTTLIPLRAGITEPY